MRSVVPKQGIVTVIIFFLSNPARSNARHVISNASVESKPPDTPTTALFTPVCNRRFFNAYACIAIISFARASRSFSPLGINGAASIFLVNTVSGSSGNSSSKEVNENDVI